MKRMGKGNSGTSYHGSFYETPAVKSVHGGIALLKSDLKIIQ